MAWRAARLALRPVNDLLRSIPEAIIVHYPDVATERIAAAQTAWNSWATEHASSKGEPWAMEAQAALEHAEARLAAVRAEPSTETAPPQEELEVPPLEGPEPWESEADQADLPPPPPPALPGGEPPAGELAPAPTDGAPQLPVSEDAGAAAASASAGAPAPLALDEQAITQGYARIAGASEDVTQVLLEKKALLKRVAELDTFLSSVKLQSRCSGCGALLAFIADRNEVDCPRCKTRLRIEGLYLIRK